MSIHNEADLVLKLYELRREETLRKAREWYALEFNPESVDDFKGAMFGERSGHLRMVMSYWDMAAALVNHGAIGVALFNETSGEHFLVFSKLEPMLDEIRSVLGPQFLANLEKLIDATPDGRKRVAMTRERMKGVRAAVAAKQSSNGQ